MINLYGTHCPKCKVIEKKLQMKGIPFNIIDDEDSVREFCEEKDMRELPLIEDDNGDVYNFVEANKLISSL